MISADTSLSPRVCYDIQKHNVIAHRCIRQQLFGLGMQGWQHCSITAHRQRSSRCPSSAPVLSTEPPTESEFQQGIIPGAAELPPESCSSEVSEPGQWGQHCSLCFTPCRARRPEARGSCRRQQNALSSVRANRRGWCCMPGEAQQPWK